jgi:hypothetical protein
MPRGFRLQPEEWRRDVSFRLKVEVTLYDFQPLTIPAPQIPDMS